MTEAAMSPPFASGSSLLSASISANAFHAPRPRKLPDEVDDSIERMSKSVDKSSDARAVAMSYEFSRLDESMGSSRRRSVTRQDFGGTDSWIDQEKRMLAAGRRGVVGEEGAAEETTPRPGRSRQLGEVEKGKERARTVKFEEPKRHAEIDVDEEQVEAGDEQGDDGEARHMNLEDRPTAGDGDREGEI